MRHLDGLPLQQLGTDALGDDGLKVGDALRLDALAVGFLTLAIEHEAHALGLLLGLELLLDGGRQQWGQLDVAQQDLLGLDAAGGERALHVLEHVLRHHLARRGVEELRLVLGGDVTDGRAQLRVDDDRLELPADRLVDAAGGLRAQLEQQRDVEADDQPLGRGHGRGFLDLPRLDAELDDARPRDHDIEARGQDAIGHGPEEILHAHVAGGDDRHRHVEEEQHDEDEKADAETTEREGDRSHGLALLSHALR